MVSKTLFDVLTVFIFQIETVFWSKPLRDKMFMPKCQLWAAMKQTFLSLDKENQKSSK